MKRILHSGSIPVLCLVVAAVVSCLAVSRIHAQEADINARYRLALSFEEAGEWERAVSLYEALLREQPANYLFFDRLRYCYIQLKLYDKAIRISEDRLRTTPTDVSLMANLGGLYYRKGMENKADSLWQRVIATDPRNHALYRVVAAEMIDQRLYERAVALYRSARKSMGNNRLFAEELAVLYGALQQYDEAVMEYVGILRGNPQQIGYVESQLANITSRGGGLKAALNVLRRETAAAPDDVPLRQMYGWLLVEAREFELAYEQYSAIERLLRAGGTELFAFGQRALQEHALAVAARAFRDVIERNPKSPLVPQARFEYARTQEESSVEADTGRSAAAAMPNETRISYGNAVALYEAIVRDYASSDLAARSQFRIGLIKKDRLFDLDGARTAFDAVRTHPFGNQLASAATLLIGETFVIQNRLDDARREFGTLAGNQQPEVKQSALFKLAQLDYYQARFDTALAVLKMLTANIGSDLTNDALELQYFIQESVGTAPAALAEFASADLAGSQHHYSEALALFEDMGRRYAAELLADDIQMKVAELRLRLGRIEGALASYHAVADSMDQSIQQDRAQLRIAEIYENNLRNPRQAIEEYEKFLVRFPQSMYSTEVRKRIRMLRGDTAS